MLGYEEDCMTPEAADLIKKLLQPISRERIGFDEIKKHDFFKGIINLYSKLILIFILFYFFL